MKKNILLLSLSTLLALPFTGCGASGDSQNPTEAAGPIAPVIAESLVPTECPESGSADDLAISIGNEAVCSLNSVQFSLSLPETLHRDMCIACSGSSWILPMYFTNFQFSETFPPGSRSIV